MRRLHGLRALCVLSVLLMLAACQNGKASAPTPENKVATAEEETSGAPGAGGDKTTSSGEQGKTDDEKASDEPIAGASVPDEAPAVEEVKKTQTPEKEPADTETPEVKPGETTDVAEAGEKPAIATDVPEDTPKIKAETVGDTPEVAAVPAGTNVFCASPDTISLVVIQDKRCKIESCEMVDMALSQLLTVLPGIAILRCDWSRPECKDLFEAEQLKTIPALLFGSNVKEHPNYIPMSQYFSLSASGKHQILEFESDFDPTGEICDNGLDDTGDGLTDCAAPTCQGTVECRPEMPNRLDLFVMSQCPYGVQALDAMKEVLPALKNIDFHVHYIVSEMEGVFQSLHGEAEVAENIRALCAMKHYPADYKYMDYIWCRNPDITSEDWKACTGANGIDTQVMEGCSGGQEGIQLLREDMKLAEQLKVGGSPTWFANNRHLFHGIAPDEIKEGLCEHNTGLEGCDQELTDESPVPAGSCN